MMSNNTSNVVIVDYDMGNLFSVQHACKKVGLEHTVSSDPEKISNAEAIILPGVGAFGDAMVHLKKLDLISPILDFVATGRPLMGICLGMQLLFSESEEFGSTKGLDIISGNVLKFPKISPTGKTLAIPQINWNSIQKPKSRKDSWNDSPLRENSEKDFMYFIHSFYVSPQNVSDVIAFTDYEGFEYCSAIQRNNVFAVQFHPEKSGEKGIRIYSSFRDMILKRKKA
ncbi:MAG: imidazole glycerol phosphate synthase subunit HisH [Leptospira sp.]|nr:imidazole glycerol phosphate synthase subunit HisH [Leptospira sp.]